MAKRIIKNEFKPNTIMLDYHSENYFELYEFGNRDGDKIEMRILSTGKKPITNDTYTEWFLPKKSEYSHSVQDSEWHTPYENGHQPQEREYYENLGRKKVYDEIIKWRRNGYVLFISMGHSKSPLNTDRFKVVEIDERKTIQSNGDIYITEEFCDQVGNDWRVISSKHYKNDTSYVDYDFFELFAEIDDKHIALKDDVNFNKPTKYDFFINSLSATPSPYTQLMAKMWVNENNEYKRDCKAEYKHWRGLEISQGSCGCESECDCWGKYGRNCFLHTKIGLYNNKNTMINYCITHDIDL